MHSWSVGGFITDHVQQVSVQELSELSKQKPGPMILDVRGKLEFERLIPKRKSYTRLREACYFEITTRHNIKSVLSHEDCFVYGKQENVASCASFQEALWHVDSIKHIIVVGSVSQAIRQAVQLEFAENTAIYYEDDINFPESGAKQFIKQKDQGIISYYDELEELSLVVQTADEGVIAKTLVKADEEFVGGSIYEGEDVSGVWINESESKLLLYLCMGTTGRHEQLRLLVQPLKTHPTGVFRMEAGSGYIRQSQKPVGGAVLVPENG